MKVRYKSHPSEDCSASRFNTHALAEVIVGGDWGQDSAFIKELDVQLASGEWKDMRQAFRDHDIIPDNHNERFGEPKTAEDRQRGFFV